MSLKITVKNLDKVTKLFAEMKSKIKPEVINKSLDKILADDLAKLKTKLLTSVNNELKSKVSLQEKEGKVEEVLMKKSDQEILKHLTGVDLASISKTRDFNTLADGKLAVVSNKTLQKANIDRLNSHTTSKMSSGVNLRLPMSEADTFDNQYSQAINYYNGAIFAIVDNTGKVNYYKNPGIDMTQYIKVVCSRDAGPTDRSKDRWDKHRDKRGFADWTLLQDGLDRVKRDFINLTDAIEKVKEGEHEDAKNILNKVAQKSNAASNITEKINDLKDRNKLDPSVESYNNMIRLLKNLQIEKSIRNDRTFYTLISVYDENTMDYQKFQERLVNEIKLWKITNEQRWIEQVLKSILGLANKLLR